MNSQARHDSTPRKRRAAAGNGTSIRVVHHIQLSNAPRTYDASDSTTVPGSIDAFFAALMRDLPDPNLTIAAPTPDFGIGMATGTTAALTTVLNALHDANEQLASQALVIIQLEDTIGRLAKRIDPTASHTLPTT